MKPITPSHSTHRRRYDEKGSDSPLLFIQPKPNEREIQESRHAPGETPLKASLNDTRSTPYNHSFRVPFLLPRPLGYSIMKSMWAAFAEES
jgi:hypothetical protein